jgi:hypothetical protein
MNAAASPSPLRKRLPKKHKRIIMGLFDFFKKDKNPNDEFYETPVELKHLISKSHFNLILNNAKAHLEERGDINIYYVDGVLVYENSTKDGTINQTNFINLVKHVINDERKLWKTKTAEYLDNLSKDKETENEILADFEKAKNLLTVRIQPASSYEEEPNKNYLKSIVYKIDIPVTYTLLALDLPSRFHILTIDEIKVWDKNRPELFEIAHNNVQSKIENIQAKKHNWDGATIFTLFDSDYSASYCIDFENNCNNLIGDIGSIISFPTRGSVFIHPISDKVQFNLAYRHIAEKTNKFFDDDPGPISRNIYWFNESKFTLFEINWNNGEITYNIPEMLYNQLI